MESTTETQDITSQPQTGGDRTVELFCSGIEFAAKWHDDQAKQEDLKGWTERAKDHRYHAEDLRDLIRKMTR